MGFGDEHTSRGFKRLDNLSNCKAMAFVLVLGAMNGVPMHMGSVCQLANRPVEQASCGSQLCACHHAAD